MSDKLDQAIKKVKKKKIVEEEEDNEEDEEDDEKEEENFAETKTPPKAKRWKPTERVDIKSEDEIQEQRAREIHLLQNDGIFRLELLMQVQELIKAIKGEKWRKFIRISTRIGLNIL